MRLDARLVAAGKVTSRSRAADLIKRGLVTLDGKRLKASDKVTTSDFDRLTIDDHRWVSRAALKLVEAMNQCPDYDPRGHACIDIGASTGGFTEVLLNAGAAHVVALDVGHDQLALVAGNVAELRDALAAQLSDDAKLALWADGVRLAINQQFLASDWRTSSEDISLGAEIAFLPPVTGG